MDCLISSTKDNIQPTNCCSNLVEVYTSEEFGNVRALNIDGEPWFVASDIAKALGYTNPRKAIIDHCKGVTKRDTPTSSGVQSISYINEGDMYRLIMKSKLPSAEKFEEWVCNEVLPTIRKTGGYVSNEDLFIETYLPFADENTKVLFSQTLQVIRTQNEMIKKQSEEIMHKENVIIGLVDNIDLATKRQRITQIVRHCKNKNYQERYRLLYSEFEKKYHCNLSYRLENDVLKPKVRNTMDYIDRGMDMIPQLYEIACKLFENDVEALKTEWESVVA